MKRAWLALAIVVAGPAAARADHHCVEVSEVVGHQRCHRFGQFWDAGMWPHIAVAFAVSRRELEVPSSTAGAPLLAGTEAPRATAWTLDSRFLYHHGAMFLGSEVGMGGGDHLVVGQLGAVVGLAAPLGRVTLSAEIFGGGRILAALVDTQSAMSVMDASWLAGPRVGAAMWVNAHLALGVTAGLDLLHNGERSLGMSIAGSFRRFGGSGR